MYNILDDAYEKKYAVPQINMNGTIWLEAILKTAEKCQAPVIIGTTDRIVDKLGGFRFVVNSFQIMKEELNITIPVVLHLDHGQTIERCFQAIDAGYGSVMYDGSSLSIEENIEKTKRVVAYAAQNNITVEAEVGSIGGSEDGMTSEMMYADKNECLRLAHETGINSLAPALGSVHGRYKGEPNLGFEAMEELRKFTDIPFVLHGASGISNEDLRKAISFGHAKINYNTELNIAWSDALRKVLNKNTQLYAPMEILEPSKKAIADVITSIFKRTHAYGRFEN